MKKTNKKQTNKNQAPLMGIDLRPTARQAGAQTIQL